MSILVWIAMIPIKAVLFVAGIVIVPSHFWFKTPLPKLYQRTPGRPNTIWELMIRNPVDGLKRVIKHPDSFSEKGMTEPGPTYHDKSFAWRWRRHKWLSSIRLVWRYNSKKYGEFYLGWKLGSEPPDLDFAISLRPYATIGQ